MKRVPLVLQLEAVECGAASLAMVLAYHGRWESLVELRRICGVSRDGSKALSIVRAGRQFGFDVQGFRYEPHELTGLPTPAIVFVNQNHFVVLEGFSRGRVHIADPALGRVTLSNDEFDGMFSGVVLTFERTAEFRRAGRAPALLRPLLQCLRGSATAAVLVIAAGIALVAPGIVIPSFSRVFIDQIVIDDQKDWMEWLLAAMITTAIIQLLLMAIRGWSGLHLSNRISVAAAADYVWQVLRLPIPFFSQRSPGNISSRIDMAQRLGMHAGAQAPAVLVAAVSMILFAAIMVAYSPLLTAIAVGVAALGGLVFVVLQRRLAERAGKITADAVKLSGRTMQGLSMIEVLKASGTEDAFFATWAGQHATVVNHRQAAGPFEAAFAIVPEFLTQLGALVVITTAGLLVMQGELTLGMLIAFFVLQAGFFLPMRVLIGQMLLLSDARATIDQFEDVSSQPLAREFRPPAQSAAATATATGSENAPQAWGRVRKLQGRLQIRDLTFGYSPLEAPLLSEFSLSLEPGSRVALVGGSGSGKSTVGRLISGLLEPWSGEIRIDGVLLDELPRLLLRNSMAVVDQDIVMFSGTVRENIALWDATMPEERIVRAAKDALIHDDIVHRPGAYGSSVEERGRNFSGGQRQRMEIARALVGDPSILVLDEATSALDPVVEKAVMDNVRRRGCTCIIIAHRLSTIRDCDEIIVMHQGRIVQRGTHDAMSVTEGPYRRLIET